MYIVDKYKFSDKEFEEIYSIVYRYYTGRISGYRFEQLMRGYGITRSAAYIIYRKILDGDYKYVEEYVGIHYSASLRSTSSKGKWAERYLEGTLKTIIPADMSDKVYGADEDDVLKKCSEIEDISDLFAKCIFIYFESKGYDYAMLETSEWYFGVKIVDHNGVRKLFGKEKMAFVMDIFDEGSANHPMNIHRWHDVIKVRSKFWENVKLTCKEFRDSAFKVGYLKSMGKQVRWV